jgi:hypothetical protein
VGTEAVFYESKLGWVKWIRSLICFGEASMPYFVRYSVILISLLSVAPAFADGPTTTRDSYDTLLHSQSVVAQREALQAVLADPEKYVPRIQQSLRDYPQLLRTDPTAASRAVYVSAIVRDSSFPPILVRSLGVANVLDECLYACPVVFALTVDAYFSGWKLPTNLDSQLTTAHDLKAEIEHISHVNLKVGSLDDVVQGPALEAHRAEIEGKSEEYLIRLAGPTTPSLDTRLFAAFKLETSVSASKNRIKLYLLALNEFRDASGEYRSAVYESIYRAELAKAQGK